MSGIFVLLYITLIYKEKDLYLYSSACSAPPRGAILTAQRSSPAFYACIAYIMIFSPNLVLSSAIKRLLRKS